MDAFWIMEHLDRQPQPSLSGFDEAVAWFAHLIGKELLGIEGWDETGYAADGPGSLVRDAQHSTDGFWTAELKSFSFAFRTWSVMDRAFSFGSRSDQGGPAHTVVGHCKGIKERSESRLPRTCFTLLLCICFYRFTQSIFGIFLEFKARRPVI